MVEVPAVDAELILEAFEEEDVIVVMATTPSPEDQSASGGILPGG